MDAKSINLEDWELFGGGGNGLSYYHKTDESIMLKLNKEEISKEKTEIEYSRSKKLNEQGLACPAVYDFVTDGKRYGMTMQRIKGKKSYARIISEDPSRLRELAIRFARMTRELHSIECDTSAFISNHAALKSRINGTDAIPADIRQMLTGYIDSFDNVAFGVHGDLNPGNIIQTEDGKDFWIDLGDFSYGDPDYDICSLLFLSSYTPAKVVEYLFHITRKQCAEILEIFGREYYGDKWHTPELDEKLHRILMVKAGATIAKNPRAAKLYLPLLKGQKLRQKFVGFIVDHLITKYN